MSVDEERKSSWSLGRADDGRLELTVVGVPYGPVNADFSTLDVKSPAARSETHAINPGQDCIQKSRTGVLNRRPPTQKVSSPDTARIYTLGGKAGAACPTMSR